MATCGCAVRSLMVFRPASHHAEAHATTNQSNIVEAFDTTAIDEPMSVTDAPAEPMADDNLSFAQITELWKETEQRLGLPSTTGSIVIDLLTEPHVGEHRVLIYKHDAQASELRCTHSLARRACIRS